MCYGALLWARVQRLIYAATADDAARAGFADVEVRDIICGGTTVALTVDHLKTSDATEPFDKWMSSPGRIDY